MKYDMAGSEAEESQVNVVNTLALGCGMDGSLGSVDSSREEDAAGLSSGDEGARSGGSRYSPEDTQRKLKKGADTVRESSSYRT
jgi:hypothetical protein